MDNKQNQDQAKQIPRNPRKHSSMDGSKPRNKSSKSMSFEIITALLNNSGRLSDLSSSFNSLDSLSSFASPNSKEAIMQSSFHKSSTSPEPIHSLYSEVKNPQGTLSRWDSWGERTPKESPLKPKRGEEIALIVENTQRLTPPTTPRLENKRSRLFNEEMRRWSSDSNCSRVPSNSPRRTSSPAPSRKESMVHTTEELKDSLHSPSDTPRYLETYAKRKTVNQVNKLLVPEVSPNRPPIQNCPFIDSCGCRLIDNSLECMMETIEGETMSSSKLLSCSSKHSFLTSRTCETGQSSTISHDFSIPWCSSHEA